MLVLFAVIFGGIVTGRLLSSRRLAFVPRFITFVIWALLFLLGLEVGSDPAVVNGMATLGLTALVIFAFSVAGSIAASWLLWRCIRYRARPGEMAEPDRGAGAGAVAGADQTAVDAGAAGQVRADACGDTCDDGAPRSMWQALRGSLVIVAFFAAGCAAGLFALVPFDAAGSRVSTYVLYTLMFSVGVTLGHDTSLAGRVRRLDPRLALLPLVTAVGTLAGAALSTPLLAPLCVTDTLAVGSGFGYYSLSSIFIADLRGAELGTVALLCNVMREIFTLLAAPLVARLAGPLAAVSIGGATTFDTTLPIITQATGKPYAVVSIFHGCMLDFSVPFLVTFFCSL